MQEFINFLNQNQGWVGMILGTASLVVALFLYWRSQIPGIFAWQSRDVSMIGSSGAVFPSGVEVQYRGTPVPRIISSTVWIWNAGKKTVKGADIVARDPLRLRFDGEILDVRIKKVSREVLRITAATSEEMRSAVCFDFEFLDSDDGGVVEVLHTGSTKAPECTGTIMGLPRGPQRLGPAFDTLTPSKWTLIGDTIMISVLGAGLSSGGLMMVAEGIYQGGLIRALIGLVLLVVGGTLVISSVWDAWINRVPSSLY